MPSPPQQSRKTLWIVLGIVGVTLLVCCSGGFGLFAIVRSANEKNERANNTPTRITVGARFEHDQFVADAGWEVAADDDGSFDIVDLALTNETRRVRSANLTFSLYRGETVVAAISCSAGPLEHEESGTAGCFSAHDYTADFDEIRVADSL